jgi:RNA polymerase sigma factor (sigma-70 family)
MNESPLIEEYAASRSDDVFKSLVDQYVGLVYSACYRQLKDRHLAEDATQAVFILLSQKAGSVRQAYLTGWLLTTSRYACANIRRTEQRRQRREQVVAMNQTATTPEAPGNDLLDQLDDALCHLKAADREALVLRYLREQPIASVAEQLGVSEDAARKRVDRGIAKLRKYFSRRGIAATSASLAPILTEQLRGATLTPAFRQAITQNILQVCRAGSHSTAASVAIAKGTKTMMLIAKLKTAAAVAILVGGLGTTGWAISRAVADDTPAAQMPAPTVVAPAPAPVAETPTAPVAASAATQPALDLSTPEKTLASVVIALRSGDRDTLYHCLTSDPARDPLFIDRMFDFNLAVSRMLIAARQAYGPAGDALKQGATIDDVIEMMAMLGPGARNTSITGDSAQISVVVPPALMAMVPDDMKPVISAWNGAPIRFKKQADGWKLDMDHSVRVDMNIKPPAPTAEEAVQREEQMLQSMTDVYNQQAQDIAGGQLRSVDEARDAMKTSQRQAFATNGVRGMNTMIVPIDAPALVTDSPWQYYSSTPTVFTAAMDPDALHNGHATLCLGSSTAVRSKSAHYQRTNDFIQKYIGHRISVTAWMKSANVLDDAGIRIRVLDENGHMLTDEGQHKDRPIKGTNDWTQYTAYATVPDGAAAIRWGFILNGKGQIWIDLDSAQMQISDELGQ